MNDNSVLYSSKSDEWETPDDLFNTLDAEFNFNLDAAADETKHKTELYFDKAQDGLKKDWGGTECSVTHHIARSSNG